eukprot:scaffold79826_cov60-Phaeocystis_antarctica.AAC.2
MPSAGRMPLTAWHEAHSGCANACNGEGRTRGGSTVSGCRVVWWAGGTGSGRVQAATGAGLTVFPLTTRPPKSTCEPCTPVSTMYTRTFVPVRSPSSYSPPVEPPVGRASDEGARAGKTIGAPS